MADSEKEATKTWSGATIVMALITAFSVLLVLYGQISSNKAAEIKAAVDQESRISHLEDTVKSQGEIIQRLNTAVDALVNVKGPGGRR
jgi:hypothetical protein